MAAEPLHKKRRQCAQGPKRPSVSIRDSTGHTIRYHFAAGDLYKGSWTFNEEFDTQCPHRPSSWMCKMEFPELTNGGRASIPMTLKRTDLYTNTLTVCIQVSICFSAGRCSPPLPPEELIRGCSLNAPPIQREGIRGGDVIAETFTVTNILPLPDSTVHEECIHVLGADVSLTIRISSCHSNA